MSLHVFSTRKSDGKVTQLGWGLNKWGDGPAEILELDNPIEKDAADEIIDFVEENLDE